MTKCLNKKFDTEVLSNTRQQLLGFADFAISLHHDASIRALLLLLTVRAKCRRLNQKLYQVYNAQFKI